MSTLELRAISKSYHATPVLQSIDLQVAAGSRTAIVGPSGSGKTTLLRIIAGFDVPDSGQVILQGQPLVDEHHWIAAHQRSIGFVPQDGALFPHFTVAGNIGFGLSGSKKDKQWRIDELMERVALDRRLSTLWPHQLSGGQQQRVALARALSQQPTLMLLDEPFSALDTGLRAATRKAVAELLQETNIASILVTHDQHEALSFADQVAVIRHGQLAQVGTPQELYFRPIDERTAMFLGETLLLVAHIETGWAHCVLGKIAVDDHHYCGHGRIMLRPEQIHISLATSIEQSQAVVTASDFAGFISALRLQLTGSQESIEIKTISQEGIGIGAQVNLTVSGKAHLFAS